LTSIGVSRIVLFLLHSAANILSKVIQRIEYLTEVIIVKSQLSKICISILDVSTSPSFGRVQNCALEKKNGNNKLKTCHLHTQSSLLTMQEFLYSWNCWWQWAKSQSCMQNQWSFFFEQSVCSVLLHLQKHYSPGVDSVFYIFDGAHL